MHELALTRNIVSIVAAHAEARPVRRVRLAIGPWACVERRALEYCFGIAAQGTGMSGACLEFVDAEGDTVVITEIEVEEAA